MIRYNFNEQKATELILYIAHKINGSSIKKILKLLFFADLYHLKNYDRPILGNYYVAMDQGPVNSKLYNMLKNSTESYNIEGYNVIPKREEDLDYFSKSDIEALNYSIENYGQYTANQLSEISHQHKSWKNAREKNKGSNNPDMDWFDMFEEKTAEEIEEITEDSELLIF